MITNLLLASSLAFIVSFLVIPRVIAFAKSKKLYDIPDARKVHKDPIPSLGGIAIFAGLILGLISFATITSDIANPFQSVLFGLIILLFVGVADDLINISPKQKLAGQVIAVVVMMLKGGFVITNMHGFLGITDISGTFSYFFTGFTVIVILNAYNLIDGIDALAGSISVITSIAFAVYFTTIGQEFYALLGYCLAAALLGFLIYNISPAKIFMGDTGSMICGFVNAVLVIQFLNIAPKQTSILIPSAPAFGFGILIMPLLDTLRVFTIRIVNGRSPFSPDRNHLHHMLLDKGLSHKAIAATMSLAALLFIVCTYFAMPFLSTTYLILAQIAVYFIAVAALKFSTNKYVTNPEATSIDEDEFEITEQSFSSRIKSVVTIITKKENVIN